MTTDAPDPHTHLEYAAAGYDVVPIIPPGATLSSTSKLDPSQLGKIPGRKYGSGWGGIQGWADAQFSREELAQFSRDGAGVGIRCGRVVGLDVDVMEGGLSKRIVDRAGEQLGLAPTRVGRWPKALLLYRLREGDVWTHGKVRFGDELVEILGTGRQFVAEGRHPSGSVYSWDDQEGHPADIEADMLVEVSAQQLTDFLDNLEVWLSAQGYSLEPSRAAGGSRRTGGPVEVDQDSLKAPDRALAERVVRAMDNTDALEEVTGLRGRDHWIEMAYAIKGAFQEDPALGEELFVDWSSRWAEGHNDLDDAQREFDKCIGPYRVGWDLIERCARFLSPEERTRQAAGVFAAEGLGEDEDDHRDPEFGQPGGIFDETVPRSVRFEMLHERLVFVPRLKQYFDNVARELQPPSVLDRRFAFLTGKLSGENAVTSLIAKRASRGEAHGVTYRPGQPAMVVDDSGRTLGNLYLPGPAHKEGGWLSAGPVGEEQVRLWLDVVKGIASDPEVRGQLLDWLAHQIQHPGVKTNWQPLLLGKPGTGKDTIILPVSKGLGENASNVQPEALHGQFNGWLLGKSLIAWQEISTKGKIELEDKMKPFLSTNPEMITVNQKGLPTFDYPNIANHLMMTNRAGALHLSLGERRVFVVDSGDNPGLGDDIMRGVVYPWLLSGGFELVCRYLLGREIRTDMQSVAPMTQGKLEMLHSSKTSVAHLIEQEFEAKRGCFERELFTVDDIYRHLVWAKGNTPGMGTLEIGAGADKQVGKAIRNEVDALERVDVGQVRVNGGQHRMVTLKSRRKHYEALHHNTPAGSRSGLVVEYERQLKVCSGSSEGGL